MPRALAPTTHRPAAVHDAPSPTCTRACMPPTGLDFMAAGPTPDCAPTSSQRRLPVAPSPARRVIIHVATCQEDLSWLSCGWHPRLTIRIIHKCTRQHPGFHRKADGLLEPRRWAPSPRPTEPCMTHITSAHPTIGRESEVFMGEIAHARATGTADDDVHIFLQGGRDEVLMAAERHMGSIAQQVAKVAGRGDLGFISLTGKVVKPMNMCWRPVIKAGLRSGAIRLDCGMSYANPVRARRRIAQAGPAPPPSRRLLRSRHVSPGAREFRRLRSAHPRDAAASVARIPPDPAEPIRQHAHE